MTSSIASRPSSRVKVYSWWTVPRKSAAFRAATKSGAPGRPTAKEWSWGHDASVVSSSVGQLMRKEYDKVERTNWFTLSNSLPLLLPQFLLSLCQLVRLPSSNGSNQTTIQTTTQQYTIRNLRHEPLLDGSLKSLSNKLQISLVMGDFSLVPIPPSWLEISRCGLGVGIVEMSGRECD
jgi:hypothetical protein